MTCCGMAGLPSSLLVLAALLGTTYQSANQCKLFTATMLTKTSVERVSAWTGDWRWRHGRDGAAVSRQPKLGQHLPSPHLLPGGAAHLHNSAKPHHLFQVGYDKRVRPNYGGIPVTVGVTLYVLSIGDLSEKFMDFTFDMYFR